MTSERTSPEDTGTWSIGVRPRCVKCDRLAVVYDNEERPFCGRHATIFMVDWEGDPSVRTKP